jgi:hypothetical protein
MAVNAKQEPGGLHGHSWPQVEAPDRTHSRRHAPIGRRGRNMLKNADQLLT